MLNTVALINIRKSFLSTLSNRILRHTLQKVSFRVPSFKVYHVFAVLTILICFALKVNVLSKMYVTEIIITSYFLYKLQAQSLSGCLFYISISYMLALRGIGFLFNISWFFLIVCAALSCRLGL